jgi:uncharacterized protein DUF4336
VRVTPSTLQAFAENLWIVDGPDVRDFGVLFTTRMTIVKLSDGSLWVDSPVSVDSDTLQQITSLGPVRHLVAATPRHVWRLNSWSQMFPEAQPWVAKPTPLTLQKRNLSSARILGSEPPEAWQADLEQIAFQGNPLIEEVIFFHKRSRTVILDDLIQNHRPQPGRLLRNLLMKLEGVEYPHGGVGLDMRLTFFHRKRARQSLEELLSWDFDRLIIAHGPCLEKDARPFVERAFRWLMLKAN